MKEAIDLIDSIKEWLTESDGGNAVTNSDVKYAKEELDQLRTMLDNLTSSSRIMVSSKALEELKSWAYANVQPHDGECHDIISRL